MNYISLASLYLLLPLSAPFVESFAPQSGARGTVGRLFGADTATTTESMDLTLSKPLGLILEEVEEGQASGVYVLDVADTGSAAEFASRITGAKLATVQGQDVLSLGFDDVMDKIVNAPDTVDISFFVDSGSESTTSSSDFMVGDPVSVVVKQQGKDDLVLEAKVGDNLRKVLLDGGFEVYQGLKQKLGNCGGGGQCTFCAVDVLESEGWEARSDYEDQKLKNRPDARLACLNNIQGPLTVQKSG